MREPLTGPLLLDLIEKLHVAFPRNLGKSNPTMMVEVYRNGLRGCSGDSVRQAVERLIQTEQFFPKVAMIREAATAWDRLHEVRRPIQWDECPTCGAVATLHDVYKTTKRRAEDGSFVREYIGQRLDIAHHRAGHHVYEEAP